MGVADEIEVKYRALADRLDEATLRRWAAVEARSLGRGGVSAVARAVGVSRTTIHAGLAELSAAAPSSRRGKAAAPHPGRVRAAGGGRKKLVAKDATLLSDLDALVEPTTRGDPQSALRWTCKSTTRLARELNRQGHPVSQRTVCDLLAQLHYSLQSTRKTREGLQHPDRDAQFRHIAAMVEQYQSTGQPVISVDTKKKEQIGDFKNGGREYQPRGKPEEVRTHDFLDVELGQAQYRRAQRLLITADCGGSNGYRVRRWRLHLQKLADELQLVIQVCHFPPGTSKWNKIEHRMLFCHITNNWRGRPLLNRQVVVNLIGGTTSKTGLRIRAALDESTYQAGIKVSEKELTGLAIERDDFHGEWNYRILPRPPRLAG